MDKKKCLFCGKEFLATHANQKFCSTICFQTHIRKVAQETKQQQQITEQPQQTEIPKILDFSDPNKCPECGSKNLSYDKISEEIVCSECGLSYKLEKKET